MIRLALTRLKEQLPEEGLRAELIAHVLKEVEQYPGRANRGLPQIDCVTSPIARFVGDADIGRHVSKWRAALLALLVIALSLTGRARGAGDLPTWARLSHATTVVLFS